MLLALLIGLGAGLASAVLFASASTGTAFGLFVLFLLSPLPVIMAGLGWGWPTAAISAALGALSLAAIGTGRAGLFHLLAIGLPAAAVCYLGLLNRSVAAPDPVAGAPAADAPQAYLEWYPVGRIVGWAAVWASVLTACSLYSLGGDIDSMRRVLGESFEKMLQIRGLNDAAAGGRALTDDERKSFVEIMVRSFPWAVATSWLMVAIINVWAASHIVRLSGRLPRPWPQLQDLTLPREAPLALAASIGLMFLPGVPGLVAAGCASAILFAYLLVGLAILHSVTQGRPARPMILTLVYGSLIMLSPFSSLLIAALGLAEPVSPIRRGGPSGGGPPPPT